MQAQSNQYLHFDKVDDYVEVPNGSGYVAGSTQITMAGWFYHDALGYGQGMMSIRGGGSGTGEMYLIQLNNGTVECRLITTAGFHEFVAPANSVIPQIWQHFAWVYNGSKVSLYVNGQLKGSTNASGTIASTNKPFTIGQCLLGGFNFFFGGRADEVSLWSKALTQQEIQDMMENELNGDEQGLELYYKFNQGVPGGDNTSISKLESETGNGDRDGNLLNFALIGETSNFGGDLDVSFQAITFPQIPNKLISDPPFELNASASSGLPVSYEIVSGPATLSGNTVTLTGAPGEVVVKASQPGDGVYNPAADLFNSFQVLDPTQHVPAIDARSPLAGDVYVPVLGPVQLAAISSISYPELFSVTNLKFEIDGQQINAKDWGNSHYTAWWTPPAYGAYDLKIISTNNFGASATKTVGINIVEQVSTQEVGAFSEVWSDVNNGKIEIEAELPSFQGAYDKITAYLTIGCPPGGCDEWDRISFIEVKGHNGQWYEIIRYITPYGVACSHNIDLTDFMSVLEGKVAFRVNLETLGNGFLYSLEFEYKAGIPAHPYSAISEVWRKSYDFGNPADLQPVPEVNIPFPDGAKAAKLKLVSSGHAWGDNNTGNAAEFHEDTHHIWVDGAQTFAQHNWQICNPNPDGCQPQNGTWFYNRAGWCPGSIAPWFDYNMSAYVSQPSVTMGYVFNENYTDFCHPNNPNCVSGVTCPDCGDTYNPYLLVSAYVITTGDAPLGEIVGTEETIGGTVAFNVFPNPASSVLNIELQENGGKAEVRLFNSIGQLSRVLIQDFASQKMRMDVSGLAKGIYSVEVRTDNGIGVRKVIVK